MNKRISILVLLIFLSVGIYCDSPALQYYIQRFSNADLPEKAQILREAAVSDLPADSSWQLYDYALRFALDSYAQTGGSPEMSAIIAISAVGLRETGRAENIDILWRLFHEYPDTEVKSEILITLGAAGKGNQLIVNSINNFLVEKNLTFSSGEHVDYSLVSACISAIMELDDSSSYPALFSSLCIGYPEVIASEAQGALELIHGDLHQFLSNVIENNSPEEKFAAFRTGANSENLTLSERGQLAELALRQSLFAAEENADLTAMRYAAVLALTSLRWTRANALAIRHYYGMQAAYANSAVFKDRFIEAIACLGAVGDSDAALILVLQLGLINARTESTGVFDPEITMAIVLALGQIGSNAAFDHLLYISSLSYSEDIAAAAREAIDRLKW